MYPSSEIITPLPSADLILGIKNLSNATVEIFIATTEGETYSIVSLKLGRYISGSGVVVGTSLSILELHENTNKNSRVIGNKLFSILFTAIFYHRELRIFKENHIMLLCLQNHQNHQVLGQEILI